MSREPVPVPVDILLGAQTALAEALRDPRTGVAVKMGFGGATRDAFLTAIEAAIMTATSSLRTELALERAGYDQAQKQLQATSARLRTELEAAKGDAVGVKALEWVHIPTGYGPETYQADTPVGYFQVFTDEDSAAGAVCVEYDTDSNLFGTTHAISLGRHADFPSAKAAAQQDFERRIRSALTADKSEAEVRQQEQIREDERDRLLDNVQNQRARVSSGSRTVIEFLRQMGAMLPEDRARSRAQGGMDKGVAD